MDEWLWMLNYRNVSFKIFVATKKRQFFRADCSRLALYKPLDPESTSSNDHDSCFHFNKEKRNNDEMSPVSKELKTIGITPVGYFPVGWCCKTMSENFHFKFTLPCGLQVSKTSILWRFDFSTANLKPFSVIKHSTSRTQQFEDIPKTKSKSTDQRHSKSTLSGSFCGRFKM